MRARYIKEAKVQPNRELFDQFKQIASEVRESNTHDPFAELNDRLNTLNIFFVDFEAHMNSLEPEERQQFQKANMIPEIGIRLLGFDPPTSQIQIYVDNSFDDKFVRIPSFHLNRILDRMWSGFGHETIHQGQVAKMNVRQDPEFHSHEEYYENKQEIMAMAFSFVEEVRGFHSDEEIMEMIRKTGNEETPRPGMRPPMPGAAPMMHPLMGIYRKLGGDAYKLFTKYAYQYLQNDDE